MSKYFEDTRRSQDWSAQDNAAAEVNVDLLLRTVQEGNAAAAEVASTRLSRCRRIRLSPPPGSPLILRQKDKTLVVAAESYRALRTRLLRLQSKNGLRSVVITSSMSGEGKTVTATNLAFSCAQLHEFRVLLVDADLRTRGLTHVLGYPAPPGLAEALAGAASFEDVVLATDVSNLYVVGAGSSSVPPPELFASQRWREFIGWASESFKLIVVDSPPMLALADFELISGVCDSFLTVVRALHTPRQLLQAAVRVGDQKKLLGAVFNAAEMGGDSRRYGKYYGANGQEK